MKYHDLGPFSVTDGDQKLAASPMQMRLLADLVIHRGEPVSADRLIDDLWGEEEPGKQRGRLGFHLSKLRGALRELPTGKGEDPIESVAGGYLIRIDDDDLDSARFESLLATGTAALEAHPDQAAGLFEQALALWTGPAYADFTFDAFAQVEARRLEEMRLLAIERHHEALLELGQGSDLIADLEGLVELYPYREGFLAQLMLALYRAGRHTAALRTFSDYRQRVGSELGLSPTPALADLEEQILMHDPALGPAARDEPIPTAAATTVIALATSLTPSQVSEPDLVAHEQTARDAVASCGGEVVRLGDRGVCATFGSAERALECSMRLLQPSQGSGEVAVSIHAGATDVFGPQLSQGWAVATELAGAGHPGQVVMTSAARWLLDSQIDSPVELLGNYRIAAAHGLEPVYQVRLGDEVPDGLRALERVTSNLPQATTSFVGRSAELGSLRRRLKRNRIVTVIGSGGCGKTRLALEGARRALPRFADGAWFVDLAAASDRVDVLRAIAAPLEIAPPGQVESAPEVWRAIGDSPMLLLVDNCEHVVEAAAALLDDALAACPNLVVLATSRERLRIPGEAVVALAGLATPPPDTDAKDASSFDAVRLLADRAQALSPEWQLTDANVGPVVEICNRLDGVPLAIELSAGSLHRLTLDEIAEGLNDRFALLTDGSRAVLPRHQTLEAAIRWSYELLAPDLAALFRRTSIFPVDWSLEGAQAVCATDDLPPQQVGPLLGQLVEKSLVSRTELHGRSRYRLLESVREFGRAHLEESGEHDETEAALVAWATAFASRTGDDIETDEVGRETQIEQEWANLSGLITGAIAAGRPEVGLHVITSLKTFVMHRDYARPLALALLTQCLEQSTGENELIAQAHSLAALLSWTVGATDAAMVHGQAAVALANTIGDPALEYTASCDLGLVESFCGEVHSARGHLERAVELGRQMGPSRLARALCFQAAVVERKAQAKLLAEAEDLVTGTDGSVPAYAALQHGWYLLGTGEPAEARKRFDVGGAIWHELGDTSAYIEALWGRADCAVAHGNGGAAAVLLDDALQAARSSEWDLGLAMTVCRMDILGPAPPEWDPMSTAEVLRRESITPEPYAVGLVRAAWRKPEPDAAGDARDMLIEAAEIFRDCGHGRGAAWALSLAACLEFRTHEIHRAKELAAMSISRYSAAWPGVHPLDGLKAAHVGSALDAVAAMRRFNQWFRRGDPTLAAQLESWLAQRALVVPHLFTGAGDPDPSPADSTQRLEADTSDVAKLLHACDF